MLKSLNQHYLAPIRSFNRAARLFLITTIINGVILSGWMLFFNFYMLKSGFTLEFLGLVNSMPSAAGLVFGLLVGRISDRIGRKPSLFIGIGFASLFMLAQITFRQPVIIAVSAFLTGVFNMLFIVSQAPLMMKLSHSENRTMLFSLNYGLQTISGAVGSLFAGQLPGLFGLLLHVQAQSSTAYQAVLIISVLLGTTSLIPVWLMKEPLSIPSTEPLKPSGSSADIPNTRRRFDPFTSPKAFARVRCINSQDDRAANSDRARRGHPDPLYECVLQGAFQHQRC